MTTVHTGSKGPDVTVADESWIVSTEFTLNVDNRSGALMAVALLLPFSIRGLRKGGTSSGGLLPLASVVPARFDIHVQTATYPLPFTLPTGRDRVTLRDLQPTRDAVHYYPSVREALSDYVKIHIWDEVFPAPPTFADWERHYPDDRLPGTAIITDSVLRDIVQTIMTQPVVARYSSPAEVLDKLTQATPLTTALVYAQANADAGPWSLVAVYAGATLVLKFVEPMTTDLSKAFRRSVQRRLGLPQEE